VPFSIQDAALWEKLLDSMYKLVIDRSPGLVSADQDDVGLSGNEVRIVTNGFVESQLRKRKTRKQIAPLWKALS